MGTACFPCSRNISKGKEAGTGEGHRSKELKVLMYGRRLEPNFQAKESTNRQEQYTGKKASDGTGKCGRVCGENFLRLGETPICLSCPLAFVPSLFRTLGVGSITILLSMR